MDSSTTRTDLVICKYISQAMEANGITQADLSKALEGRSKGYVSDRVLGKRSWAISELDRLAPLFGLPDALSLVAAACGSISSEAARAYEARERQKITDDLVDRIAAHPEDYGMAEEIYEGAAWPMAVELGVTVQVLMDYRQLLHDSGVCMQ